MAFENVRSTTRFGCRSSSGTTVSPENSWYASSITTSAVGARGTAARRRRAAGSLPVGLFGEQTIVSGGLARAPRLERAPRRRRRRPGRRRSRRRRAAPAPAVAAEDRRQQRVERERRLGDHDPRARRRRSRAAAPRSARSSRCRRGSRPRASPRSARGPPAAPSGRSPGSATTAGASACSSTRRFSASGRSHGFSFWLILTGASRSASV